MAAVGLRLVLAVQAAVLVGLQVAEQYRARQVHQDKAMLVAVAVQHSVGQAAAVGQVQSVRLAAQAAAEQVAQERLPQLLVRQLLTRAAAVVVCQAQQRKDWVVQEAVAMVIQLLAVQVFKMELQTQAVAAAATLDQTPLVQAVQASSAFATLILSHSQHQQQARQQ